MISVSVIIPTYNGANKILNTLRALEEQSYSDFEVIVVIDGSTDDTAKIIRSNTFKFHNLSIIEQENSGRAAVRNRGAKEAKGDILIFFDDDMRPVDNCVRLHIEHHKKHNNTFLVGSQLEDYTVLNTDIQRYKAFLSRKWTKPLEEKPLGLLNGTDAYLTAANFSISKELFDELQGFDDRLTDAEDHDLAVRARKRNIQFYFSKEAIGWHDDFITCKSYINRQRQYIIAHNKLKAIKPDLHVSRSSSMASNISVLKKVIYGLASSRFWPAIIDKDVLPYMIPKLFRYKLYAIIIESLSKYYPNKSL
jgi:glycosyltransferase involved in cell wall biosynthesis